MKNLFIALLFIVFNTANAQNLSSFTDKYESYYERPNQGIGMLVKQDGKTEFSSIGDIDINEESVFNIGSATKKMTAILLLQEEEKGNLSLQDSIGTFLDSLQFVDGSLTIEDLLRHRSGLGEIVGEHFEKQFYSSNQFLSKIDVLKMIPENNPELFGKHDYCNTNYFLLGCILENVTDKSYFDLLRERIFEPCALENTYPYVSKGIENLVRPIHKGEDVFEKLNYKFFAEYAYAAGSVASTLSDMEKFYVHLFEKKTLLNDESINKLIDFDDADYGLGMMEIEIDGTKYYGHGGNNLGYAYREYYNPVNNDMFLMFSNVVYIPYSTMIKKDCINYITGKDALVFESDIAKDYKKHLGTYFFKEMNMNFELLKKNNELFLSAQGKELPLISLEANKLMVIEHGIELEVDPKDFSQLIFRQNGFEGTINRVDASEMSLNQ